jgi:hypothetical protein
MKHSDILKNLTDNFLYVCINYENQLKLEQLCNVDEKNDVIINESIIGFYNVEPSFFLKYKLKNKFLITIYHTFITQGKIWNKISLNSNYVFTKVYYCSNSYYILTTVINFDQIFINQNNLLGRCYEYSDKIKIKFDISEDFDYLVLI